MKIVSGKKRCCFFSFSFTTQTSLKIIKKSTKEGENQIVNNSPPDLLNNEMTSNSQSAITKTLLMKLLLKRSLGNYIGK